MISFSLFPTRMKECTSLGLNGYLWFLLRHMSRSSHPPGSMEGNVLASEILQKFRQLRMDHTWTDSHYATLQFPSRYQVTDDIVLIILFDSWWYPLLRIQYTVCFWFVCVCIGVCSICRAIKVHVRSHTKFYSSHFKRLKLCRHGLG